MVGRGGDGGDVGGEGEGWLGTCRGVGWVGVGVKSGVCGGVHGCGGVWGREGGAGRGRVSIWVCEWGGYIYIYIYICVDLWQSAPAPSPPLLRPNGSNTLQVAVTHTPPHPSQPHHVTSHTPHLQPVLLHWT